METIEQKRELLAALHRELKSGYGVTNVRREERVRAQIRTLEAELDIPPEMITDAMGTVWCAACGHKAVDEGGKDPVCAYCAQRELSRKQKSDRVETAGQWRALDFDEELDGYPLLSPEGLAEIATDPEYQRWILATINNFGALIAALEQARTDIAAMRRTYSQRRQVDNAVARIDAALAAVRRNR